MQTLDDDWVPTPNVATELIENLPEVDSEEFEYRNSIAKHVSAISYIAGADTVSFRLVIFYLPPMGLNGLTNIDALIRFSTPPRTRDAPQGSAESSSLH